MGLLLGPALLSGSISGLDCGAGLSINLAKEPIFPVSRFEIKAVPRRAKKSSAEEEMLGEGSDDARR